MMKTGPSWPLRIINASTRQIHWFAVVAGLSTSMLCIGFLLSNPFGTPQGAMFMGESSSAKPDIAVLPGLSGTTYRIAQLETEGDRIIGDKPPETAQQVGWNEMPVPGCLTVTAENGQKLSFRINGYRASRKPDGSKAAPSVDLAVTDCAQSNKAVVRAVFEPDAAETVLKSAAAEHNL